MTYLQDNFLSKRADRQALNEFIVPAKVGNQKFVLKQFYVDIVFIV